MDCGIKMQDGPLMTSTSGGGHDVAHPSFSLQDDLVDQFQQEHEVEVGDEITATVKLKVTGMSDEQHGKRLGFDVLSLDVEGDPENPEEEAGEAAEEPDEKPKGSRNPAIAKLMESEKS
jgi:hypothetical protein